MEIKDFILAPIFLAFVYAIAFAIRKRKFKDNVELGKYFIWGLNVKIGGAIATAMIYWYYYGAGDSIYYFWRTQLLRKVMMKDPGLLMKLLFTTPNNLDSTTYHYFNALKAFDMSTFIVVKIAFFFSIPAMGTYLLNAFLFSLFCYVGLWRLFRKSIELFPDVKIKYLAYAVLFIPSVFFWGSGLFKDTITMGCICLLIVAFHDLVMKRRKMVQNFIIVIVSGYFIGVIKSYILLAMVPAVLIWVTYAFRNKINSAFLRQMVTPFILVISIVLGGAILRQLGTVFTKFNLDNIEKKAEGMQRWHTYRVMEQKGGDGSVYSLGHVEFTPAGMLRKLPAAVNVTLFRPYLWEAGNPVMLMAALESLVFTYFFLWLVVFNFRFAMRQVSREAFLMFCVIYTIVFAFSVGFTSYNFGALVRYKIPCLPMFGILLAVLYGRLKAQKELKKSLKVKEELPVVDVG